MRTAPSLLACLLTGCFLWHQGDEDAGASADASAPLPGVDAGPDVPDDVPVPADPDPDLGPGSRPSDYPDADDWEPPSSPSICCDLDDPVRVEPPVPSGRPYEPPMDDGPAQVEWSRDGWGVFLPRFRGSEEHLGLVRLAPEGRAESEARRLEPSYVAYFTARWAEGRFGLAAFQVSSWAPGVAPSGLRFGRFDERGVGDGPLVTIPMDEERPIHGLAVARLTHGDRWVVVHGSPTGIVASSVQGGALEATEAVLEGSIHTMSAVGLRSRVVVVTRLAEEAAAPSRMISFGWPPSADRLDVDLPDRYPLAVAALRDDAVIIVRDEASGAFQAVVADPFEGLVRSVSAPWSIDGSPHFWSVRLAADDKHGRLGACFAGPHDERSVFFQLLGIDGAPLSEPVLVAELADPASFGCSIGYDGVSYLVAWKDRTEGVWVRRVSLRDR